MIIQLEMPCKPLVKQYIRNRYGAPVAFPHNDYLKSMLYKYLCWPNREHDKAVTLQYYTDKVLLPVPYSILNKYGNELTNTSIMHINQTVQDLAEEQAYNFLQFCHIYKKVTILEAVEQFRDAYHFPEESWKTDALVKFYQRTRKRRAG